MVSLLQTESLKMQNDFEQRVRSKQERAVCAALQPLLLLLLLPVWRDLVVVMAQEEIEAMSDAEAKSRQQRIARQRLRAAVPGGPSAHNGRAEGPRGRGVDKSLSAHSVHSAHSSGRWAELRSGRKRSSVTRSHHRGSMVGAVGHTPTSAQHG